ncbi:phage portal protein [Pseudomonas putida]
MDFEQRNLAQSSSFLSQMRQAEWTSWTVQKTTSEGIRASGWVYLAIKMISDAIASVPVVVYNPNGKVEWNHPLTKLFAKPHPDFSRADLMRLMAAWTQLTGTAYMRKVTGLRTQTRELWPVSPDRIAPFGSADNGFLLSGYEIQIDGGRTVSTDYTRDTVVRVCLADPANPLLGLSPLMAAARAVDIDRGQQDWNKALLQNRGNPDIAISVKGELSDNQRQSLIKSIMSKFRGSANAGKPLVLSGETTITRLGLSQAEMDFLASRKWNRDEILAIFGVPAQLAGAMESSSFNNFAEAKRIFWINTVLPLLGLIIDAFNSSLHAELSEGYYLGPDLTGIDALSDSQDAKLDRAGKLYKMGVPFSVINELYGLGVAQYEGWDKPFGGRSSNQVAPATENRSAHALEKRGMQNWSLMPTELRNIDKEIDRREEVAQKHLKPAFEAMLDEQRKLVFGLIDDGEDLDSLGDELHAISERHIKGIRQLATEAAVDAGKAVIVAKKRSSAPVEFRDDSNVALRIASLLTVEQVIEVELGLLNSRSVDILTALITDSRAANETIQQLKDRLTRGGYFEPERALLVARTLTGSVSSVGQMASAEEVGAKWKIWNTSGGARDGHAARAGQRRLMHERYSSQYGGSPRWPCDSSTTVGDRANCRCSQTFE